MKIMNPINEIFIKTIRLHEAKWYQFITKYKLNKEISDIKYYLMYALDIFSLSDEIFAVYNSLPNHIKHKVKKEFIIGNSHIGIADINKYQIVYTPKNKEFRITEPDYGIFTIRKDTGVSGGIRMSKWKDIQDELRILYLEVIMDTAKMLAEYRKDDQNGKGN